MDEILGATQKENFNENTNNPIADSKIKSAELKDNEQVQRTGKNGIKNLGNTCYLNAALQCLSYTGELIDYFLSDKMKRLDGKKLIRKQS